MWEKTNFKYSLSIYGLKYNLWYIILIFTFSLFISVNGKDTYTKTLNQEYLKFGGAVIITTATAFIVLSYFLLILKNLLEKCFDRNDLSMNFNNPVYKRLA